MRYAFLALALLVAVPADAADRLRVIAVAPNDVLNIRERPSGYAPIIGIIPPDGRDILYSGDGLGEWLFVRYGNVEGYVDSRFVRPENYAAPRGRVLSRPDQFNP